MAKRLGAIGRGHARRVDQVLGSPRDSVKGPPVLAGRELLIRFLCLRQRGIAHQGDHAAQLGIEPIYAIEVDASQPFGGELPGFDPTCESGDRRIRNRVVARG